MSAATLIRRAQASGVRLRLVDGVVKVRGNQAGINAMLDELRVNKDEIAKALKAEQDAAGTVRPPGMSEAMMAASMALDRQVLELNAQRMVLGLFEKFKPPKPETKLSPQPKQDPVDDYQWPAPVMSWEHVDSEWRHAAREYYAHHFTCPTCIAAGRGTQYGKRCAVGLALWSDYDNITR